MPDDLALRRRSFLACAGATAVIAADPVSALAGEHRSQTCGPEGLFAIDKRDFESLIGDRFAVRMKADGGSAEGSLVLTRVQGHSLRETDRRPAHVRQEPFSLLFVQRSGDVIADATHRIRHPNLGAMDLLLQRVSNDRAGGHAIYEAVFA